MGRHYCYYCDVNLTHDSTSVRKAHNTGRNHLQNVRDYYLSLDPAQNEAIFAKVLQNYEANGLPHPTFIYNPPQTQASGGFRGGFGGGRGGFGGRQQGGSYGRPPPSNGFGYNRPPPHMGGGGYGAQGPSFQQQQRPPLPGGPGGNQFGNGPPPGYGRPPPPMGMRPPPNFNVPPPGYGGAR